MNTNNSRRRFLKISSISLAAIGSGGLVTFLKRVTEPPNFNEKYDGKIDHAFRLTDHNSLLNLEFYFINCEFKRNKIWAKYSPYENYMVVRLPQQHITENSFEADYTDNFYATTYISGYSYLVFRILFPEDKFIKGLWTGKNGKLASINLKKECLLDWGNEDKFRLVVRQDLTEPIFQLKKVDYLLDPKSTKDSIENPSTFQQKMSKNSIPEYDINLIPKVYGDPVTAIELPWRLVISPKLPDSSKYKFKWNIPKTDSGDGNHQLWTATLSIEERADDDYKARKENDLKNKSNANNSAVELNESINQLELMILGSPDHPNPKSVGEGILPTDKHRSFLVSLYIQLKIIARTDSLTFSPLGASVKIHLKNNQLEKALAKGIPLIEWNQIISFGRDEKVEVSTLFLEAEFGHKMAYIETAQRELRKGKYPLIKRGYIVPLDIEKDYTRHITQKTSVENKPKIVSKFGSPFKKIKFLEISPKETKTFQPSEINFTKTSFEFEAIDWQDNIIKFKKQINAIPFGVAFKSLDKSDDNEITIFKEFISDTAQVADPSKYKELKFKNDSSKVIFKNTQDIINKKDSTEKSINLVNLDTLLVNTNKVLAKYNKDLTIYFATIENDIKESVTAKLEFIYPLLRDRLFSIFNFLSIDKNKIKVEALQILENNFEIYLISLFFVENRYFLNLMRDYLENVGVINEMSIDSNFLKENLDSIKEFLKFKYYQINPDLEFKKLDNWINNVESKQSFDSFLDSYIFNCKIRDLILDYFILDKIRKSIYLEYNEAYANSDNSFFARFSIEFPEIINIKEDLKTIFYTDFKNTFIDFLSNYLSKYYEFQIQLNSIPNLIRLQKQKIGYAVVEKIENRIKKSLSELETEYIIFQGAIKESANQEFDFFHEYAIMPQVTQAKVYISAINKLIEEDIPISINYATEYLENQIDEIKFEVGQNASMVFAEIQQFSRDQIKGLVRKLGDKMPGINVEFPAHYLTYLKHPDQAKTDLLKNVDGLQIPEDLQNASRDLVFISEEIKNTVRTIEDLKAIDPKKYFKDFGAMLFGSISLENILGIGFDPPRLTEFPDRILYQFSNDQFQENRAAFVSFKPDSGTTKLDLLISKSLKNTNDYFSYISLNNFSVGVIIGEVEVLTVYFNLFKITSSPGQPKKTDISIRDVKLGGPLQFIADIAAKFMAPGNGMRINAGPKNLEAQYGISLPDIEAPAFNFRNLQFKVGLNIPYDPNSLQPISFSFGLNSKEDKFLVSAGIYGGRGHFMLKATPKGIEQIDISIEMGAYASLNLGIGKGEVFLFFGLWFVSNNTNNENNIKAVAYVLCSGSATVLGFITIGVSVLIAMTYIKRGAQSLFYGEAIVTYSVKVAFFKKTFSIRYQREFAGSLEGDNSTGTSQQQASFLNALAFLSPKRKRNKDIDTDNTTFQDVFKDEKMLDEYINCFN